MIQIEYLATRISGRRRELHMTQNDLAQALHVSPQAVSKWERAMAFPNLAYLDELATTLHLSFEELLFGTIAS